MIASSSPTDIAAGTAATNATTATSTSNNRGRRRRRAEVDDDDEVIVVDQETGERMADQQVIDIMRVVLLVVKKFSNWLKRVLSNDSIHPQELGSLAEDLGTHSFRKGVVTYSLSFPGGPSAVAAYLRAGWSLGNVSRLLQILQTI
jgi:hypothetical protein